MKKGFMKLSNASLLWLGGSIQTGGRLHNIDMQIGCPWQCLTCAVCAPRKSENMKYEDYETISDSILEVKEKKDIDILSDTRVHPFFRSDFILYHSQHKGTEKTAYDITMDLKERHLRDVTISTAGWRPGNTYMQRAMEQIINSYTEYSPYVRIHYSIKTVSEQVRREYDTFMARNSTPRINTDRLNHLFIKNSRYVAQVIQNLFTLAPLNKTHTVSYELQWISEKNIETLDKKYSPYTYLFSGLFMDQLKEHIERQWRYKTYSDETIKQHYKPEFNLRTFKGGGRALEIGKIDMIPDLEENIERINSSANKDINDDLYLAHVNCNGEIEIYYGEKYNLGRIYVPKKHFIRRAQKESDRTKKDEYMMLADLQGTNILK